ncbi:hypothetical protein J4449_04530 [Candidatus Woesearchaeota archaeon]|nr:hypothetical protein [Candidatus Woesearchaeota archaeon]
MEKDNKVVLGAVLILLVGMLSFNFAGSLTGKTVNKGGPDVVLTVSPSNVYFSFEDLVKGTKVITLTVNVNKGEAERNVYIYRNTPNGGVRDTNAAKATLTGSGCRSSNACEEGTYTINYLINSELNEGDFFFRVSRPAKASTSTNKETFDSNTFTVTHYTPPYY